MKQLRFIDIGANLTDSMYQGIYHGSKKHEPDLTSVLDRAFNNVGIKKLIITGGSLEDSQRALELAKTNERLYSTVGCHPTRCNEFNEFAGGDAKYLDSMKDLILGNRNKVIALGEFGLDYDRTQFCDPATQKRYFEKQLSLNAQINLPLFLHCRNACSDLISILAKFKDEIMKGGVVHSFDGTIEEAQQILELGFSIGINGCSLKTDKNLEVVKSIPSEKLMIETDCPWCEIRPSHAGFKYIKTKFDNIPVVKKEKWKEGSFVKSRNEPCMILHVLEIIAALKEEDPYELSEKIYQNTIRTFDI